MSKTSLRYARALALVISEKAAVADLKDTADNLDLLAEVFTLNDVQDFFANPRIAITTKENVVAKIFGGNNTPLENFLKLIVHNDRITEIVAIAESFRAVLNESAGVATAQIESANELDEKQILDLTAALRKMTNREIAVETRINPQILGGVKIFLGDELVDLSLSGKLRQLQKVLN